MNNETAFSANIELQFAKALNRKVNSDIIQGRGSTNKEIKLISMKV